MMVPSVFRVCSEISMKHVWTYSIYEYKLLYMVVLTSWMQRIEQLGASGSDFIHVWINNYIHYKAWDEIINPFLNFYRATIEV